MRVRDHRPEHAARRPPRAFAAPSPGNAAGLLRFALAAAAAAAAILLAMSLAESAPRASVPLPPPRPLPPQAEAPADAQAQAVRGVREVRAIDGSGNNRRYPRANVTNSAFTRYAPARYADGASAPVGGPNARLVSNTVVGEGEANVVNGQGLSAFMFAWGQFIAHDLALGIPDGISSIDIAVPNRDPVYPDGTVIPMTRMIRQPGTGVDPARPAIAINTVTGWLDASMVYGSDAMVAARIRLPDGRLRTSTGDNLVIADGKYIAGDVRVQETPPLTALHTLFVREHNWQVARLRAAHPGWSGERLYQEARAVVAAEIAHITFAEFLPHLIGPDVIPPWRGYDPEVDARVAIEFTGAAFRLGHSLVSEETAKLDENGTLLGAAKKIADTFFQAPERFAEHSGAAGVLRHLAADPAHALDVRVVDSLRNRLNDPPASKDLAATNIQRGRELGIATLNAVRVALGLPPHADFHALTGDPGTREALQRVYESVDDVELWPGGLAERPAPGAMVGETFQALIARQFIALRDGDRLWYGRQLDPETLQAVRATRLSDIILRNTTIRHIQDDVFRLYQRISGLNGGIRPVYSDVPMLVIGSDGDDTLIGGPAGDDLVAGRGRQVMTGGEGPDRFVFGARGSDAVITDFRPGPDVIVFRDGVDFDLRDAHVRDEPAGAVVEFAGNRILIEGVRARELDAYRFLAQR